MQCQQHKINIVVLYPAKIFCPMDKNNRTTATQYLRVNFADSSFLRNSFGCALVVASKQHDVEAHFGERVYCEMRFRFDAVGDGEHGGDSAVDGAEHGSVAEVLVLTHHGLNLGLIRSICMLLYVFLV